MSATAKILITEIEGDLKPEEGLKKSPAAKGSESSELLKAQAVLFAWLFFLVIGGGMMALYYSQIGYLPDIDWHSLLIYLAAATIIGGSIGGLEVLLVFLPGYIWSEILIVDSSLIDLLCFPEPGKCGTRNKKLKDCEPCVFAIFKYLGFTFVALFALAHFWLIPGVLVKHGSVTYFVTISALIIIASVYVSIILERKYSRLKSRLESKKTNRAEKDGKLVRFIEWLKNSKKRDEFTKWRKKVRPALPSNPLDLLEQFIKWWNVSGRSSRLTKYWAWFALSALLSQIALFLIYKLASKSGEGIPSELQVICVLGVLISNHIVAARFRKNWAQAVIASVVAVMLLLFAVDHYTSLSKKLMALYGFGGDHKVCIVLNEEGVEMLPKLGLPKESWLLADPYRLNDVAILSTVGSDYFLSIDQQKFILPKSAVRSWVRED